MEFDKTSLPSLIWFLHMPRDKIVMISYSFVTDTKCIASYLLITNFAKLAFWPNRAIWLPNCFGKTVVTGHVHWCITLCSSGVKRCSWSLWKADMMHFNFDVHGWYWFNLDLSEKCHYFLLFSLIFKGRFFLSVGMQFLFFLILITS